MEVPPEITFRGMEKSRDTALSGLSTAGKSIFIKMPSCTTASSAWRSAPVFVISRLKANKDPRPARCRSWTSPAAGLQRSLIRMSSRPTDGNRKAVQSGNRSWGTDEADFHGFFTVLTVRNRFPLNCNPANSKEDIDARRVHGGRGFTAVLI